MAAGLLARLQRFLSGSGLNAKLVFFSATLTAGVVSAALVALLVAIHNNTREFVAGDLRSKQQVLIDLQHRNLTQLLSTSSLMTQSPTLRAAMETYRREAGDGALREDLLATIQLEAAKIVAGLGKDLLVVTDERGAVLASVARFGPAPPPGRDLSALAAVGRALDPASDIDRSNFGVIRMGVDHYFQVGVVPIVLQGFIIGTLALGTRMDEAYLADLQTSFRGDITITVGSQVVLATLSPAAAVEVAAALGRTRDDEHRSVSVDGEEYVTASLALGKDAAGEAGTVHLLHSLTGAVTPVNREFMTRFLASGSIAVVLAGLGAAWVARSVLGPLHLFVNFVRNVADTGLRGQRFDADQVTPEVSTLNDSYNHLLDSLLREQKRLEQRTTELSTLNRVLTEQIGERERVEQELRESEERLRQSQKMEAIGTLAGGVAHDFNNLLTVISGYTEMALAAVDVQSELREDLQQIGDAARRAARLTHQLLAFSRKQVLRPELLDLNTTVSAVEKLLRRLIGEDIVLQVSQQTPLPKVMADPGQMEQVLVNLAVNARDAMPTGGTLLIETRSVTIDRDYAARKPPATPGPFILLAITDSGVGMDGATLERIFDPFFTTKDPGKGTGLGLSTAYGIVKQSGGFIWAYSEQGVGTSFKIYLPVVASEVSAVVPTAARTNGLEGSETILLVEDDDFVRELAATGLVRYGYHVIPAAGAADALEASRRHDGTIDLLLTDVVMPHTSGRELASQLRIERPNTPVLFMSGYTDEAVVNHGIVEPGTHFLQKPFGPVDLAGKVRDVLAVALGERV